MFWLHPPYTELVVFSRTEMLIPSWQAVVTFGDVALLECLLFVMEANMGDHCSHNTDQH